VTGFAVNGSLTCALPSPGAEPSSPAGDPNGCGAEHAAAAQETEPNGAPACAQILLAATTVARAVTGTVTAGDEDWYRLPEVAGGAVLARTSPDCTGDTIIDLRTATGSALETNDDVPGSFCSALSGLTRLPAGAVYLRVRAFAQTTATYTLRYVTTAGSCNAGPAADGNQELACATAVSGSAAGSAPAGDVDWYWRDFPAGATVTVATHTTDCSVLATSDTVLDVRTDTGSVASNDDDPLGGVCSVVTFTTTAAQRYFIAVSAFGTRSVPSYTLSIVVS
jgi:hypothetical protein